MYIKLISLLISLSIGSAATAAILAPESSQLLAQNYFVNQFYAFSIMPLDYQPRGQFTLINQTSSHVSTKVFDRYLKFDPNTNIFAKDLILFKGGAWDGRAMMITTYRSENKPRQYQMWLPELRKVRRFPTPAGNDQWLGSVFTQDDMQTRKPNDETFEVVDESTYNNCPSLAQMEQETPCFSKGRTVLKVVAVPKNNSTYDYRVIYMDKETYADYRSEYFKNGLLIKSIEKNWLSTPQFPDPRGQMFTHWVAKDYVTGNQSILIMKPIQESANDDMFELSYLEKTKR